MTPAESASDWSRRYHDALARSKTFETEPPVYCPNCGGTLRVGVAYPLLLGPFASGTATPMFTCGPCGFAFGSASVLPGPPEKEGP